MTSEVERPDLVDRDGDTWHWIEGYTLDPSRVELNTREEIEADFGPVREMPDSRT